MSIFQTFNLIMFLTSVNKILALLLLFMGPKFDFLGGKIGILTNFFLAKIKKNSFLPQIKQNRFRANPCLFSLCPSIFGEKLLYYFLYNSKKIRKSSQNFPELPKWLHIAVFGSLFKNRSSDI